MPKRELAISQREIVEHLEEIDAMFVQAAAGFEHFADRIFLRRTAPSTLYFGDRPERVVGHIGTAEFVSLWDQGDDSFATDPPNAVLSFVGHGSPIPDDIVMMITDPQLHDGDLSYAATILEGEVPMVGGGCSLFIDPFGRPLSPVSVAGMRRRTRRRERRQVGLLGA